MGERLRELRVAAGVSQMKIAKQLEVSRNAVSQWESGQTQPTTKHLISLSRIFKVPLEQITQPSARVRERVIEHAMRLFGRLGYEEVGIDVICASAEVSSAEFEALFESKDALLYEVVSQLTEQCLADVRRSPPSYGNLATQLKYLLRHFYEHDVRTLKLMRAFHAYTWRWSDVRERAYGRRVLEFHDLVINLLERAARRGEIDAGNYRAASGLILAAYQLELRKAVFLAADADRLVDQIEPMIAIVLAGLGLKVLPGFSHDNDEGS